MNFIIKLSKSKESEINIKYDFIMMIMNRLTKQVYFISFQESMMIKDAAYLFNQHIAANHESSAEIISNRDIRFTFMF